jgi:hypothetical protein
LKTHFGKINFTEASPILHRRQNHYYNNNIIRKTMKSTTQYMKHLLNAHRASAHSQRFDLQRMHDLGLEPRKDPEPLPAWAEAFHDKVQRYWGGGIEAEHTPTVG